LQAARLKVSSWGGRVSSHDTPELVREPNPLATSSRKVPWDLIVNGALAIAAAGAIASYLTRPIVKQELAPIEERVVKVETKVEVLESQNKDISRRLDEIKADTQELIRMHLVNGYADPQERSNGKRGER